MYVCVFAHVYMFACVRLSQQHYSPGMPKAKYVTCVSYANVRFTRNWRENEDKTKSESEKKCACQQMYAIHIAHSECILHRAALVVAATSVEQRATER